MEEIKKSAKDNVASYILTNLSKKGVSKSEFSRSANLPLPYLTMIMVQKNYDRIGNKGWEYLHDIYKNQAFDQVAQGCWVKYEPEVKTAEKKRKAPKSDMSKTDKKLISEPKKKEWKKPVINVKPVEDAAMTKEQYFKFAEQFMNQALEISKKKNADYAGDADPFRNFKSVGSEWVEIGFYTRMSDKMSRLKSFIEKKDLQVKDESIKDTLQDLMNYCTLLAGYLESKKNECSK